MDSLGSRIRASDGKYFVQPLEKDWGEKTEFDYDDGFGEDR